jgi:hypothetical protein
VSLSATNVLSREPLFRVVLAFRTEEQRVDWTKTDAHQASFATIRDSMAKGSKTNSYDDVV